MGVSPLVLFKSLQADLAEHSETSDHVYNSYDFHKRDSWPDIGVGEVAALALQNSIFKKFEDEKFEGADDLAIQKFLDCNDKCNRREPIDTTDLSSLDDYIISEAKDFIFRFFDDGESPTIFNVKNVSEGMMTGPGASVGATGDSYYHKIGSSPLTGTARELYILYKRMTDLYSLESQAEKIRSESFGEFVLVAGSKLSCVPKTREISRTICTEPLLNMLVQKGVSSVLKDRIERVIGIDLSIQPAKNAELAKRGSLTQEFGTIDLSSASDTISLALCRELIPSSSMRWFDLCRSPATILPNGSTVSLNMVASMGNDYTFPLQTLIFSSIVIATYRVLGIPVHFPRGLHVGNFAVFGDDIIVKRNAYNSVVRILQRFGFVVNVDKSFNEGHFRESCGSDFWAGVNVRGVYCRTLKTQHDVISLINRLHVWSCNHAIPLTRTIGFLLSTLKSEKLFTPPWENDDSGLKVPLDLAQKLGKIYRCKNTNSLLYRAWCPKSRSICVADVDSRGYFEKRRIVIHNPPALLLAAVRGYLRGSKLSIRQSLVQYKKRIRTSPGWDWHDTCHSSLTNDGWHRFLWPMTHLNFGQFEVEAADGVA